uniref:Uncharacterized protein LOC111108635 n=1 Tax=Crassostrea virginica TaxID=6565 RepID=A0A8B8BA94_CRAVI
MSCLLKNVGYIVWTFSFLAVFPSVNPSHFRGGLLTWTAVNRHQIIVHHRLSYVNSHCSSSSMSATLTCFSGCSNSATMIGYCTNSDASEDWMDSEGITRFDFNPESQIYIALGFTSAAWIFLFAPSSQGSWSFKMTVDLATRTDTGKINQSPVTSIASSFILGYQCNYGPNIYIP